MIRLEVDVNESAKDLNHELFSEIPADGPSDALNVTVRPLKKELTRLNESLRILNSEVC